MKTTNPLQENLAALSRRDFVQRCALGAMALASAPILGARDAMSGKAAARSGAASRVLPLDGDWLFGGKFTPAATAPAFNDAAYERIALPHAVTKQSWQNWNPADWQDVWIYRRHFTVPKDFMSRIADSGPNPRSAT